MKVIVEIVILFMKIRMIFIDSYYDQRTGYKFTVTPTGVQGDELRYDDVKRDSNWNGIWYSEGLVDDNNKDQ